MFLLLDHHVLDHVIAEFSKILMSTAIIPPEIQGASIERDLSVFIESLSIALSIPFTQALRSSRQSASKEM